MRTGKAQEFSRKSARPVRAGCEARSREFPQFKTFIAAPCRRLRRRRFLHKRRISKTGEILRRKATGLRYMFPVRTGRCAMFAEPLLWQNRGNPATQSHGTKATDLEPASLSRAMSAGPQFGKTGEILRRKATGLRPRRPNTENWKAARYVRRAAELAKPGKPGDAKLRN